MQTGKGENGLRAVLKLPLVWGATLFLLFYVGIEVSLGSWGYTFLLLQRQESDLLAGWIVSGYWLGLTLGRFLLNYLAERVHLGLSGLLYLCMGGIVLGIGVLGSFPAFLPVRSLLPHWHQPGTHLSLHCRAAANLVPHQQLSSAMGFLIGLSILGVALFPWIAGTLAQYTGIGSLLPYTLGLTVVMLAVWWTMRRKAPEASAA